MAMTKHTAIPNASPNMLMNEKTLFFKSVRKAMVR